MDKLRITKFIHEEIMTNNTYYLHRVFYADNRVAGDF